MVKLKNIKDGNSFQWKINLSNHMLRSNKKSEKIQDIRQYGIDITKQLESLLVDELTKSIDAKILKTLRGMDLRRQKTKKILEKIKKMKND